MLERLEFRRIVREKLGHLLQLGSGKFPDSIFDSSNTSILCGIEADSVRVIADRYQAVPITSNAIVAVAIKVIEANGVPRFRCILFLLLFLTSMLCASLLCDVTRSAVTCGSRRR